MSRYLMLLSSVAVSGGCHARDADFIALEQSCPEDGTTSGLGSVGDSDGSGFFSTPWADLVRSAGEAVSLAPTNGAPLFDDVVSVNWSGAEPERVYVLPDCVPPAVAGTAGATLQSSPQEAMTGRATLWFTDGGDGSVNIAAWDAWFGGGTPSEWTAELASRATNETSPHEVRVRFYLRAPGAEPIAEGSAGAAEPAEGWAITGYWTDGSIEELATGTWTAL